MKQVLAVLIGMAIGWLLLAAVSVDDSSQVGNSEPPVVVDTKPATEPPTQQPDAITPSPAPSLITDGPTPLTEEEFADLQQWLRDKKPLQEWIDAHPPKEFSAKDVARLVEQVTPDNAACQTCDGGSAVQFPPRVSQSVSVARYYVPVPQYQYYRTNGYYGPPRLFNGRFRRRR